MQIGPHDKTDPKHFVPSVCFGSNWGHSASDQRRGICRRCERRRTERKRWQEMWYDQRSASSSTATPADVAWIPMVSPFVIYSSCGLCIRYRQKLSGTWRCSAGGTEKMGVLGMQMLHCSPEQTAGCCCTLQRQRWVSWSHYCVSVIVAETFVYCIRQAFNESLLAVRLSQFNSSLQVSA